MGQRYLCIWYKSSKPDLVIFNAGVTLLTLELLMRISSSERWGLGFAVLIMLMDLCPRSIWHSNCDAG